jgi:hypothetical protein
MSWRSSPPATSSARLRTPFASRPRRISPAEPALLRASAALPAISRDEGVDAGRGPVQRHCRSDPWGLLSFTDSIICKIWPMG